LQLPANRSPEAANRPPQEAWSLLTIRKLKICALKPVDLTPAASWLSARLPEAAKPGFGMRAKNSSKSSKT
jgi:hypothetical protein